MTDKYTETELKKALESLSEGSESCHHIYGFNEDGDDDDYFVQDHELSKLQTITATRVLDYNALQVCTDMDSSTKDSKKSILSLGILLVCVSPLRNGFSLFFAMLKQ